MGKQRKYRITGASDFFGYGEGKLSAEERNAFERQLQRDPFAEDAAEGFAMISREEAEADLKKAAGRIRRRINRRQRIAWYSVAAAVASILVVTTIFIQLGDSGLDKYKTAPGFSEAADEKPTSAPALTMEEQGLAERAEKREAEEKAEQIAKEMRAGSAESGSEAVPSQLKQQTREPEEPAMEDYMAEEEILSGNLSEDDDAFAFYEDEISEDVAVGAGFDPAQSYRKGETVVIAEEKEQISADTEQAVSPNQLRSRRAEKKMATAEAVHEEEIMEMAAGGFGYQKATPAIGDSAYFAYIDSALVWPAAATEYKEAVVELTFTISPEGQPGSFEVLSTPSQPFSDEAIRVIKSGPLWIPAFREENNTEEPVRMKIVFIKD